MTNSGAKGGENVELPFKASRKASGYTAETAAGMLHIDKRSLYRIEAGQQPAPPEMVWGMTALYQDPGLVRWHQSEADPIGRRINPPVLNGIVNSPQAVHLKLAEELEEAAPAATRLSRFIVNKLTAGDFAEHERRQYFILYGKCVSNVKQAIAEVEGSLMRMFGVAAIEEVGRVHRDRMLQKGYLLTKEKAPAEGTHNYSHHNIPLMGEQVKETGFYYQ
jgi:hypothetical protein